MSSCFLVKQNSFNFLIRLSGQRKRTGASGILVFYQNKIFNPEKNIKMVERKKEKIASKTVLKALK